MLLFRWLPKPANEWLIVSQWGDVRPPRLPAGGGAGATKPACRARGC